MSAKDSMKDYLAQNPRMIGALFTMFVLLSQAGTVVAGSSSQIGP
ncbi:MULTISPECIES: DUF7503 family protein [Natrinema]|uniref:Uncharacterized protein n=2 Tax=Natrinema TaxID=88723 RepID=L9ZLF0_NATA2|nr:MULTISPECIES: hypothetical protein [Natrinema]AFO56964.1 hypothetical protein NJ7G_1720 [Natrinema sp. J7-2]ELY82122.1 hypothetical protein C486_05629 [Natrinema gari JCM 14663]ELY86876.1 hypothetical protein C485_08167 [Natrinema altunense JCM 12890]